MPHEQTTPPRCACGRLADVELHNAQADRFELARLTCGHPDCERHALGWGALLLRNEGPNGWRHYLHGVPVHCGSGLLLALGDARMFDGLYPVRDGIAFARVRYESPLGTTPAGREPPALFYVPLGTYDAILTGESHMRLRWPLRPAR